MSGALLLADNEIQAGPVGLGMLIALVVVSYFLYKSFARHMKRVPPSFDPPQAEPARSEPARSELALDEPSGDEPDGPRS